MKEASYWRKINENQILCTLCPHSCRVSLGEKGKCQVRENKGGKLYSLNYGYSTSLALDPIEKKPLYHFYPGNYILSLGSFGCNFKCLFCQNWQLAQCQPELYEIDSDELVAKALQERDKSIGLAYTYSEPTVWFEFVLETARKIKNVGLKNVMVSNGFIQEAPLVELLPYIDAFNIDLKGFDHNFYQETIAGDYLPVLATLKKIKASNKHLEITTLLIPGKNDDSEGIEKMVSWIATNLGKDVPLHFTRYFPSYKLDLPPTSSSSLLRAKEIAKEKLTYVYIGNAPELT